MHALQVAFHRTGGASATFDITIKLTAAAAGGAGGKPLELGQIDAAELPKLQAYCMNQRIRVSGTAVVDSAVQCGAATYSTVL